MVFACFGRRAEDIVQHDVASVFYMFRVVYCRSYIVYLDHSKTEERLEIFFSDYLDHSKTEKGWKI